MRIHSLQHVAFEGLGSIEGWARDRGHALTATRFWAGDPLPVPGAFDWLIVMGGPMSVHDGAKLPWLAAEKRFLRAALDGGKRVLGICLGAQLLAEAMGARIARAREREIGWFPVALAPGARDVPWLQAIPERWEVFHWHGEEFDLPPGATRLAGSDACENQAFIHGPDVCGFQFHPEATPASVQDLVRHSGGDIEDGPYIQAPAVMLGDEPRFLKAREQMREILDALAGAGARAGGAGRSMTAGRNPT